SPQDVSKYLELAKLLVDLEKFDEAESILLRGIESCSEASALGEQLTAVRELRSRYEMALAEAAASLKDVEQNLQFPWLETVLLLAGFALLLQLFPAVGSTIRRLIDIRQWSRTGWFVANIVVAIMLCLLRFAPTAIKGLRHWRRQRIK